MTPRLRFAPSPTGYLHVGGLRTALFCFLYAKKHQGKFIFRLEDTDQKRKVEGAEKDLIQMLQWAGLNLDESPEIGGNYGPYRQSDRLPIYQKHLDTLLKQGNAYPCFCTPERLEKLKAGQKANGETARYDGHCRTLSPEEVKQKKSARVAFTVRMKIPDAPEALILDDLIRSKVSIDTTQLDDQVLLKSDGFPTYHLAMVVDDHLMKITHVVRGEEWLPSFPKHLLLFRYFGWTPPQFAHLPLILNTDRSKLSKRQGDVSVEDFLNQGYLPEALINFIALLGWNSGTDQELFTLEELVANFSFEQVGKSGSIFDRNKLYWMNQQYLHQLNAEELFERLLPFINQTPFANEDEASLRKVCCAVQKRLGTLLEIQNRLPFFFDQKTELTNPKLIDVLKEDESRLVLQEFLNQLSESESLDRANLASVVKKVQKATGLKGKKLWMPLRYAITLEEQGPDLKDIVDIFGKQRCVRMLEHALEL